MVFESVNWHTKLLVFIARPMPLEVPAVRGRPSRCRDVKVFTEIPTMSPVDAFGRIDALLISAVEYAEPVGPEKQPPGYHSHRFALARRMSANVGQPNKN